jgi:predicted dehydrogenase
MVAEKVAIIGARGVGRHHANWWRLAGVEVAAVLGTTQETAEQAAAALRDSIGFRGKAYADLNEMLLDARPVFVDVCSPHLWHAPHVRSSLDAGAHVLCEKPFVYEQGCPREQTVEEAQRLAALAECQGRRLSVCLQYMVLANDLHLTWKAEADAPPRELRVELAVPVKDNAPDPEAIWADLGPHPLSLVQALLPDGEPRWDSLSAMFEGYNAQAAFDCVLPDGHSVHCDVRAYRTAEAAHTRRVVRDGDEILLEGVKGEDGEFALRLTTRDGGRVVEDPMRRLIRSFAKGDPLVTPEDGVRNLDWLLTIRDAGIA